METVMELFGLGGRQVLPAALQADEAPLVRQTMTIVAICGTICQSEPDWDLLVSELRREEALESWDE